MSSSQPAPSGGSNTMCAPRTAACKAPCDAPCTAGTLKRLERDREDETNRAMRELQRVSGIGVQRAKELIEGGVTTLEALRQDEAAKAKLSRGELIGLEHVYDFEHRIPRAELAQLEEVVLRAARAHDPPLEAVVCGSYRRGAATSGDIDVLLTHPSYQQLGDPEPRWLDSLIATLEAEDFVTDVIAQGPKKCAAVCILRPQHAAAASTAAASPPPAAAPLSFKLPSWREVEAERAAKKQPLDLFARARAAASASTPPSTERPGGAAAGGTATPATTPAAPAAAAAGAVPAAGSAAVAMEFPDGGEVVDEWAPVGNIHRRIDLKVVPRACLPCALLHFTGSDHLNKRMRLRAGELGYKLSEYQLVKVGPDSKETGAPEQVGSEEAIFKFLGMEYIPPGPARSVEG